MGVQIYNVFVFVPKGSKGALPYYKAKEITIVSLGDVTDFSVKKVGCLIPRPNC